MQYDLESYRNNKCSYTLPMYPWERIRLMEIAEKEKTTMKVVIQNALAMYIAPCSKALRSSMLKEGRKILIAKKEEWKKQNEGQEVKKHWYQCRLFYWEKLILFDRAEKESRPASKVMIDAITMYLGSWNRKEKYSLINKGKRRVEEVRQQWKNASESKHENDQK